MTALRKRLRNQSGDFVPGTGGEDRREPIEDTPLRFSRRRKRSGYRLHAQTYRYRAKIIKHYVAERTSRTGAPGIVEFRSWLTTNFSRHQARKMLSYFHSMVLEMVNRGVMPMTLPQA